MLTIVKKTHASKIRRSLKGKAVVLMKTISRNSVASSASYSPKIVLKRKVVENVSESDFRTAGKVKDSPKSKQTNAFTNGSKRGMDTEKKTGWKRAGEPRAPVKKTVPKSSHKGSRDLEKRSRKHETMKTPRNALKTYQEIQVINE
jgi:hypothetical protein